MALRKRWFPGADYRRMADFNRRRGTAAAGPRMPGSSSVQRSSPLRPPLGAMASPPAADILDVPAERSTRDILAEATTGVADRRAANILSEFEWQEMASSRIARAGYSGELQEVRVVWTNRPTEVWSYFRVPRQTWEMFVTSDSPGRYINQVMNAFPYSRIQ